MRLFINESYFISILPKENGYSCQIMYLVTEMGMYLATIVEDQTNILSCILYDDTNHPFTQCKFIATSLDDITNYHKQCIEEYYSSILV